MKHRQQPLSVSVLGSLRSLIPVQSRITLAESLRVAERQAIRLLELHAVTTAPVPTEVISELSKISVEYTSSQVWGATLWDTNRQAWIIHLSSAEPPAHNRFTLAHEYKHIVDHGRQGHLYRGTRRTDAVAQAEQAADYFAGCLLVPRSFLKSLWDKGVQTTGELAEMFNVSEQTIGARLRQTGIADHQRLRHLPPPLPFIAPDEVEMGSDRIASEVNNEDGIVA